MGKPKPQYDGHSFDSLEELELYWWCEEALRYCLIGSFEYQKPTWELAASVIETIPRIGKRGQPITPKTRVLLQDVQYTVDFHILGAADIVSLPEYIDVKPKFTRRNDTARYFSVMRKWLYQRHGVLVHSLVPYELFQRTFAPVRTRTTPKKGLPRRGYCELLTVEEFVTQC